MKDQREARRVPWVTGVECDEVATGRRHRGARLGDISLTGALVEGLPALPEGTRLRLHFTLPSLQMDIGATLVRVTPGSGVGLLFHDMTPVHRVVIQELMRPEMADSPFSEAIGDPASGPGSEPRATSDVAAEAEPPAATSEATGEAPPASENRTASEVEVDVESVSEPDAEVEAEAEPELEPEPETGTETEAEPEPEPEVESMPAAAAGTSTDSVDAADTGSDRVQERGTLDLSLPDLPPLPESPAPSAPPLDLPATGESAAPDEPIDSRSNEPDAPDSPALEPPLPVTRPLAILPLLGSPRRDVEPPLPGERRTPPEPAGPKDFGSAPTRRLEPGFLTAPPLPPAASEESAPAAVPAEPPPPGAVSSGASGADPDAAKEGEPRPRVLVVDDHDRTRTMLRGMIEGPKKAFVVTEAQDGEDCLRVVAEQDAFDLIFLDVDMPRLDGFQTCRRLREQGVRSPIIFLTGRSEIGDFRAGREAGADTYIKKPIVLGTLRSMLSLFTSGSLQRR